MRDPEAVADMVVSAIKSALGPVLERLAAAEARITMMTGADTVMSDLRDRVVAAEMKAEMPRHETNLDAALTPTLERLAVIEASLTRLPATDAAVTDLRERLVVAETKAAVSHAPETNLDVVLTPVLQRLASVETTLATIPATEQTLADVRDRVIACETKAAIPVPPDPTMGDLRERLVAVEMHAADAAEALRARVTATETRLVTIDDIRDRLTAVETKAALPTPDPTVELKARMAVVEQRMQDDGLTKTVAAISERVAVVEVRAQVPGPSGKDGKDGADGLGFEDLDVQFDGNRTMAFKFERGSLKKVMPIVLPYQKFQGVYQDGHAYSEGDIVTWAGSTWHCNADTTIKPGEGSKDWTLCVKRGRDGRDGRDAPGALPVVSVGRVS